MSARTYAQRDRDDLILLGVVIVGALLVGAVLSWGVSRFPDTVENAKLDAVKREREGRVQAAKLACWEIGGTPVQSLQNGEVILCAISENPTCRGCGTRRDR